MSSVPCSFLITGRRICVFHPPPFRRAPCRTPAVYHHPVCLAFLCGPVVPVCPPMLLASCPDSYIIATPFGFPPRSLSLLCPGFTMLPVHPPKRRSCCPRSMATPWRHSPYGYTRPPLLYSPCPSPEDALLGTRLLRRFLGATPYLATRSLWKPSSVHNSYSDYSGSIRFVPLHPTTNRH